MTTQPAICVSGASAALFEECFHFQIFHGQYRNCQEPSAFKHFCPDSNLPCTVHVLKETPLRVTHNYQCSVWCIECIDIILMAQRSLFYFQLYVNTFAEQCICILLCANNRKQEETAFEFSSYLTFANSSTAWHPSVGLISLLIPSLILSFTAFFQNVNLLFFA